jgi:hypothetical protein
MKCTRYIGGRTPPGSDTDPALLPPLAPPEDREAVAADWLAHLQAGRIAVR